MTTRTVFLFSGGFDSVAAIQTLMGTDKAEEPVTVLHVLYENHAMTFPQYEVFKEYAANKFGEWEYATLRSSRKSPSDALDVCLETIKYFGTGAHYIGDNATELEIIVGYKDDNVGTDLAQLQTAVEHMRRAYQSMGIPVLPVKITSPIAGKDRFKLSQSKVLNQRFWSCRNPNIEKRTLYKPCGECFVCQELADAGVQHPELRLNEGDHLQFH
ncbi:hypothetical protein [Vibrio phage VCPH]|nr:hypothetical protein [Vibrio phage VCPH]